MRKLQSVRRGPRVRLATLGALVLGAATAGACNDFLQAENPGAVEETDVNQPQYVNLLMNGIIGEFQPAFGNITWWNAIYTDELYNRNTFFEEALIDRRQVGPENGTHNTFIYPRIHRARFLADDGVRRMKEILGDSASRDLRVARALAYGGMTYNYLGEMYCDIPFDGQAPQTPEAVFRAAMTKLDSAVAIANAAKTAAKARVPLVAGDTLAADSVRNFALVGAARAALNVNDRARAATYAGQVPAAFAFFAQYSTNSTAENHRVWQNLTAASGGTTDNTPFRDMAGDVRIPRSGATGVTGLIPRSPASYSTFDGTPTGSPFVAGGTIRIASGLEARYIVAETQIESNPTAVLALINERRAFGRLQQPVTGLTGAALLAELRDQRRRDFYLDNHRLGDLRRYQKFYQINEFPTGPYPTSTTGDRYDTATCWPLALAEINSNPNIPR
ncbi:RagB/SusD family nutrient uptake outer membrane protein [Roseisolibacter sp. H3M3-2]|uniref:RagB/SusD family nutrient uptake outer membrane protein n=1 Tax=Roseisolibacter sp. H3M3-2 TaxID=3031323 RepID=UPI0023DC0420|nr:RagB/SusD family nutrient uptake outer membrane protein [Roseisolibacter sp. H3M3-2]MDF1501304.1 hypothetical protein [Roseisolibacter sp. H3M3-2]